MGAAAFALASFEIAIGSAGAAFADGQHVVVHADAHAAACVAPLETCVGENFVEAFGFGLMLYDAGAGDDEGSLDIFRDVFSGDNFCGGAEIGDARVGAGADENAVDIYVNEICAGLESHVFEGARDGFLLIGIGVRRGIGNCAVTAETMPGFVPQVTCGAILWSIEIDGFVEGCAGVARESAPVVGERLEIFSARDERLAFEISDGGFVGGDHAGAGAAFDGHVAHGHAAFHVEAADGFASVFENVSIAAGDADFADDGEDYVFGGDAGRKFSVDDDVSRFGASLLKALRGENVLDFAGADAEGESAEGSVSGSVAIAADDGEAGLSDAEFGADDVDDALIFGVHVEEADSAFEAILCEGFELRGGVGINDGEEAFFGDGGDAVIHHGEGEIGAANFSMVRAQAREGLGRSAFVNQVAINVNERGLAGLLANHV